VGVYLTRSTLWQTSTLVVLALALFQRLRSYFDATAALELTQVLRENSGVDAVRLGRLLLFTHGCTLPYFHS
jgi:hypothetical protein